MTVDDDTKQFALTASCQAVCWRLSEGDEHHNNSYNDAR